MGQVTRTWSTVAVVVPSGSVVTCMRNDIVEFAAAPWPTSTARFRIVEVAAPWSPMLMRSEPRAFSR